ncbi:aminotransferase class V-fold PLP-dependent enzyme [Ascidiimonas aurantiaca]|uniref:aminotransferase class V-fold PLP-dependent enzyme n=1 Tax=Ascidiimonas aurantiaca TaxID=1685432 RepID=UPI0030EF0AD6
MKDFTREFPLLTQYTYLNTASSGLLSESLMYWRQEHDMDFLIKGSLFRDAHHTFLKGVRKDLGIFFGCAPERIALLPNFSFGYNTLLKGLGTDKKILLLEDDYPSVSWPVATGGFSVCYASIDENLESTIEEKVIAEKPDVLALSLVQYINGIKVNLDFLKNLKKKFPELLIVADGTQYCGTEPFHFEDSGIDVLGASGYKWLLAGYGNGFMFFRKGVLPLLYSHTYAMRSANTGYSEEQAHLINHFEPGHQDTLSFGSLQFSLRFLDRLGKETIQDHVDTLSALVFEKLSQKGFLEAFVVNRKEKHSSIFNIKGDQALYNKLRSHNILTSMRGSGIRISFHMYNTEKDIKKLLKVLGI